MSPLEITLLMFIVLVIFLAAGLPIAFTMGGVGVIFSLVLWGTNSLAIVESCITSSMVEFVLVALPAFVFMAMILERSGLAEDLYAMMYAWFGPVRGGLAIGTVIICAIFAAMTGISGAATVSMGLIALPSMLKRNYQKSLTIGCISAGGALGILIPPSNIMILYGSLVGVSVGKLFMGGVFPGLLLAGIFCAYIAIRSFINPKLCPALPPEERAKWREKFKTLRAVILPILLIIFVLGSIFTGIATPTEAAAVGAGGSVLCAAIYRRLNWTMFRDACYRSIRLTAMVMWIVFGAKIFTAVYTALGAPALMQSIIAQMETNRWLVMAIMQLTFFFLGMIIDPVGIVSICAPVFVPVATSLGFDPVWYGVLFVMNMEMAYITPPFGFNLFYMKGVVPKGITMGDIYRSVWPYVALQGLALFIVIVYPEIAMWLVGKMIGQ